MSKLFTHLLDSLRSASVFNPEAQVAPACILWPDFDRQWESAMPFLQSELPQLLILSDTYEPARRLGPAIWLRCVLAGCIEEVVLPPGQTPIVYLPGVGRQELRAVENCLPRFKPLAELQYRSVFWSQVNGKDWTILAFLKSEQGGLGLDAAQDNDSKKAMQLALTQLLEEDFECLRGKRLDQNYFNNLLTGGDPIRDLLQWLDEETKFQEKRDANAWQAFTSICQSKLAFNPNVDGVLTGCAKLANQEGPWQKVWERYCEAPKKYPNIPGKISQCKMPNLDLFDQQIEKLSGWPQWNDKQEKELHQELQKLEAMPAATARTKLLALEQEHCRRRELVWAELGKAPLAQALEHLATVAKLSATDVPGGNLETLTAAYCDFGWQVDDAVIHALSKVRQTADCQAVACAVKAVYQPWLEQSARQLQKLISDTSYPGGNFQTATPVSAQEGDCILFVDGLRFDLAKRLQSSLQTEGLKVEAEPAWAALPSVTATGKPAVSPVRNKIHGADSSQDFEPEAAATGITLRGGQQLKKLLADAGWTLLQRPSEGGGKGMAWSEFGNLDHEGHERGGKLALQVDMLLAGVKEHIQELLQGGWQRIRVVTDHGWLLMPGELPKAELTAALADKKWGRCATLKPGATANERLYPWYWNPHVHFVLADGVSCFRKGMEYAHGGLSLQECLTLQLTVTADKTTPPGGAVDDIKVVWRGLRCTVAIDDKFAGLMLDIRLQAGNPGSSVIGNHREFRQDGTASAVVENEDLEGETAMVVVLDGSGALMAQTNTVIGGEKR